MGRFVIAVFLWPLRAALRPIGFGRAPAAPLEAFPDPSRFGALFLRQFLDPGAAGFKTSLHHQIMSWYTKIQNAVADTITLDVLTATGTLNLTNLAAATDSSGNPVGIDFEELAKKVTESIRTADLEVVAFTHAEWDCDSVNFVKKNLSEKEMELLAAHQEMVNQAHAQRRAAVEMLASIVKE